MWLCKFMKMGMCERGEHCTFAHNYDELHMASPDLPGAQLGLMTEHKALMEEINGEPDLQWKKKVHLCTQFERGECLLGKRCQFAHGEKEVGTVALTVSGRVKTSICSKWKIGRCNYGIL